MPDFNNLPLILAGPLLRRVEPDTVTVWMALSRSCEIELGLWTGIMATNTNSGFFGNSTSNHKTTNSSIRLGEKLHLALITLDLSNDPLVSGQLFSYNLVFNESGAASDFNSIGLLTDQADGSHLALGYIENVLPSFAIPLPGLENLKIVHSSCRKPHGPGTAGLSALDKVIERVREDVNQRPHQLFLTGDQIYADDVASVLLPQLNIVGNELLGTVEHILLKKQDGSTEIKEATLNNFPATWRQQLVAKQAKFTSTEASNHIISFGEYCAHYLLSWSNVLWDPFQEKDDLFLESDDGDVDTVITQLPQHIKSLFSNDEGQLEEELESRELIKEFFEEEKKSITLFLKALPKVRRVLANTPCYMIFDDHEITDDWNLTQGWRDRVLTSPLGVNVLRNGLLSYALFQDWGNDPKKYQESPDFIQLLALSQQIFPPASAGPVTVAADELDGMFGFGGVESKLKWHYSVKSGPTHTVVLDTRTSRELLGQYTPPGLLSTKALDEQLPSKFIPSAGAEVLIVVSPAPVMGLALIEELLQPLLARARTDFVNAIKALFNGRRVKILGYLEWDFESWSLSPGRFEAFLARLHEMKKVVLLSGDVHYSFSAVMDYWEKGIETPSRFVQLVSSASKNEWPLHKVGEKIAKRMLSTEKGQKIMHNAFYPVERLGWENDIDLVDQVSVPGGIIPSTFMPLLNSSPTLLPVKGWPPGTTIDIPPDWSWRMRLLKDERPDNDSPDARPADAQPGAISPDVDVSAPEAGYLKILLRHEKAIKKRINRSVQFSSNIGIVSFNGTGDTLTVTHAMTFQHPEGVKPNDPQAYTLHKTNLTASTNDPPALS